MITTTAITIAVTITITITIRKKPEFGVHAQESFYIKYVFLYTDTDFYIKDEAFYINIHICI